MLNRTPQMPRSLEEIMADGASSLSCPKCGCVDMMAYKSVQMVSRILRYRACRHCGHKVITRQPNETILRDVSRPGRAS